MMRLRHLILTSHETDGVRAAVLTCCRDRIRCAARGPPRCGGPSRRSGVDPSSKSRWSFRKGRASLFSSPPSSAIYPFIRPRTEAALVRSARICRTRSSSTEGSARHVSVLDAAGDRPASSLFISASFPPRSGGPRLSPSGSPGTGCGSPSPRRPS